MPAHNARWSSEMLTLAKDLWGRGYSATQVQTVINRQFSIGFSRNAVIGALHRSDAPKKGTPGRAIGTNEPVTHVAKRKKSIGATPTPRKLSPKGYNVASAKRAVQKKMEDAEEPQLTLTKELDPATNVDLLNLEEGLCKWPVSDTLYCGSPIVMKRKPYCSIHAHQSGDRLRQTRLEQNYQQRRAKPTRGRFW